MKPLYTYHGDKVVTVLTFWSVGMDLRPVTWILRTTHEDKRGAGGGAREGRRPPVSDRDPAVSYSCWNGQNMSSSAKYDSTDILECRDGLLEHRMDDKPE